MVADNGNAWKRGSLLKNPEIARFGHIALITPDIEKSLWFFRDVVGLEEVDHQEETVYLKAWGDFEHHTLSLTPGSQAKVDHVAWRTKHPEDVEHFAELFEAKGTKTHWIEAGEEKGQGKAIRFQTPNGYPFEVYYDVEKPEAPKHKRSLLKSNKYRAWDHGVSPRRVDHVNLSTANSGEVSHWLQDNMGFNLREYIRLNDGSTPLNWLSVTALSHDIAVGTDTKGRPNRLHHLAYYLDNWHDVLRAADIFAEHDISTDAGPGRHAVSQAVYIYVKDPGSGHRLELYSGSYLILDPDWEPIEWNENEYRQWWGEIRRGPGAPMDETTEC